MCQVQILLDPAWPIFCKFYLWLSFPWWNLSWLYIFSILSNFCFLDRWLCCRWICFLLIGSFGISSCLLRTSTHASASSWFLLRLLWSPVAIILSPESPSVSLPAPMSGGRIVILAPSNSSSVSSSIWSTSCTLYLTHTYQNDSLCIEKWKLVSAYHSNQIAVFRS